MTTTLVTGGRGFIGRHIVEQLRRAGDEVVSYNRDFAAGDTDGVHVVQGELFDVTRLISVIDKYQVDRIVHTAGQSHPGISIDIPWTTFAANAQGTFSVFEAARAVGVPRVVNFSSECALGVIDSAVVDDTTVPAPTTPYGVTKVTGELLGRVYNDLYKMEVISLRVTEVYGPGLWMPSLLGDMIRAGIRGETFTMAEGADHPFQFIYVDDVATAACLAAQVPMPPQSVFLVSGGTRLTVSATADLLKELLPGSSYDIGPGYLPHWDRQGTYDMTATQRHLGYTPAWDLKRGLQEQVRWLRDADASRLD